MSKLDDTTHPNNPKMNTNIVPKKVWRRFNMTSSLQLTGIELYHVLFIGSDPC